jgi:hypothetical protein
VVDDRVEILHNKGTNGFHSHGRSVAHGALPAEGSLGDQLPGQIRANCIKDDLRHSSVTSMRILAVTISKPLG